MPSLNFTIPTDKQADVLDALREKYGVPAATPTQLTALMEQELKQELIKLYQDFMRRKVYTVSFD